MVITENGYKAYKRGGRTAVKKEDIFCYRSTEGRVLEEKVSVPAGTSVFIIGSPTRQAVAFHLLMFCVLVRRSAASRWRAGSGRSFGDSTGT